MASLEVIRAGAGSGKTTELCNIVAAAVSSGLDPSRILATTFTKKAAAELKSRMQARLLDLGVNSQGSQYGHSDRFDLAAIGTVHSVASRLISRYAILMGLSPSLEVLDEESSKQALNELLGSTPGENWLPLSELAMRLDIDELQKQLLFLLATKRGNAISDEAFREQMHLSGIRLCELLGQASSALGDDAGTTLVELATIALREISALSDSTNDTKNAKSKLRALVSNKTPSWGRFVEAQKLKAGKKSGAHNKLSALTMFAGQVRINPQLHKDVMAFSNLLAEETIRLSEHYDAYKTERGFVDYIDLEILFLKLLLDNEISG